VWILEEIIKLGRSHGAWFATHADIVRWVKEHAE
jgi:hypothetical protein